MSFLDKILGRGPKKTTTHVASVAPQSGLLSDINLVEILTLAAATVPFVNKELNHAAREYAENSLLSALGVTGVVKRPPNSLVGEVHQYGLNDTFTGRGNVAEAQKLGEALAASIDKEVEQAVNRFKQAFQGVKK